MEKKEYEELKSKFFATVAKVPLPLRDEIIAVVGDETITWSGAKEEISRDTKNAEPILRQLKYMKVI